MFIVANHISEHITGTPYAATNARLNQGKTVTLQLTEEEEKLSATVV